MEYCYFPTAPAVVGCSKATARSYRLACNISWQLTSKTRKSKNSRYDVSVSSKAYRHDASCCAPPFPADGDFVRFHSLFPSFLNSISNNPDAVMLFLILYPFPVADFRHVLAVLVDVLRVFNELVLHHLLQLDSLIAQLRQPIYRI